jgi:periplasmic protein CpxP/Spy
MEARRRRLFKFAGLGALFGALGSAVAWKAYAHGGYRGRGPIDPARMEEHLERMLKHFYVEIDATEAQRARLEPIVKQAVKDLLPMRERLQQARKQGLGVLTAPSVDRGALERLRADQIQAVDAASQRLTQALADVGDVLTPEQRAHLAERLARRRGWGHG